MGRATGWTTWSWNLIWGGLRLCGGLELKSTGLGVAARQAPGSTSGLAEAGGDRQPQRSRTSSSLEALLWWSPWRCGRADTHFLLSPQLIRSSSSSDEWRSRLASKRRRRRRRRAGEMAPWLCCWLVAKGVRAQFLRLSGEVNEQDASKKKHSWKTVQIPLFYNYTVYYLDLDNMYCVCVCVAHTPLSICASSWFSPSESSLSAPSPLPW